MAFTTMPNKPPSPKKLGLLLQEQQEPFLLEIFLLERGYNLKNSLRKSASWSLPNKRRKVIPSCSKIVKAVLNKLVSIGNTQKAKNSASGKGNSGVWEIQRSNRETAESDRFSSDGSTTVFHSCSGSDVEKKEVVTDRKLQWRCREEEDNTKDISPVSVLEEISSNEVSPVHNNSHGNARKPRDSILAIPMCKSTFQSSSMEEPSCADPSSQYIASKRVMHQSKQLIFDCVRELVETRKSKGGIGKQFLEYLGPEEIGKLLYENMRTWSKLFGNETNTTQLLSSDFANSVEEWSGFETQMGEIGAEIGDAILQDIISKEIVEDMFGTSCTPFKSS